MDSYRRRSIFWPLILISVGVLFLYQQFNPAVHPWEIIAKYWPALIIIWGISKLIEHLTPRPGTPPPVFTASEVVLLVLILIFGSLVSAIVLHPWGRWGPMGRGMGELFMNSYTYSQTLSQPVTAPDHLVVVDPWGDIEVHASSAPELSASIKETVTANDRQSADELARQIQLSFSHQGGAYTLQSNLSQLPRGGSNIRLDIVLHAPAETSADLTAGQGDILLDGLSGSARLTDKHGDVHVMNASGRLQIDKSGGSTVVSSMTGDIHLEGRGEDVQVSGVTGSVTIEGDFSGAMQFQNVSQTLRFTSSRTDLTVEKISGHLNMDIGSLDADGVGGPFNLTTRQKDIRLANFDYDAHITDANGDVQLRPAAPLKHPIEVDLKKGDIELDLPASAAFQIDAVARGGDVYSSFSAPGLHLSKGGGRPSISGGIGANGPTIRLRTTYGTIRLSQYTGSSSQQSSTAANSPGRAPLSSSAYLVGSVADPLWEARNSTSATP